MMNPGIPPMKNMTCQPRIGTTSAPTWPVTIRPKEKSSRRAGRIRRARAPSRLVDVDGGHRHLAADADALHQAQTSRAAKFAGQRAGNAHHRHQGRGAGRAAACGRISRPASRTAERPELADVADRNEQPDLHRRDAPQAVSTGSTKASESALKASKNVALPMIRRARMCQRENGTFSRRARSPDLPAWPPPLATRRHRRRTRASSSLAMASGARSASGAAPPAAP